MSRPRHCGVGDGGSPRRSRPIRARCSKAGSWGSQTQPPRCGGSFAQEGLPPAARVCEAMETVVAFPREG